MGDLPLSAAERRLRARLAGLTSALNRSAREHADLTARRDAAAAKLRTMRVARAARQARRRQQIRP